MYDFWFYVVRESKVKATKDHGKNLRTQLATSFSTIVISPTIFTLVMPEGKYLTEHYN